MKRTARLLFVGGAVGATIGRYWFADTWQYWAAYAPLAIIYLLLLEEPT